MKASVVRKRNDADLFVHSKMYALKILIKNMHIKSIVSIFVFAILV